MHHRYFLLIVFIIPSLFVFGQSYDTLSLGHSYEHKIEVLMLDGLSHKGSLIDANDTAIIIGKNKQEVQVYFLPYQEIQEIKLYRSNFERTSTTNIVIVGTGAASFFVVLKYYRDRRETLKFKNSEWLFAGFGALLSMPVAGLISSKIYSLPRERYYIDGNLEEFDKILPELKAYAIWPYLVSLHH